MHPGSSGDAAGKAAAVRAGVPGQMAGKRVLLLCATQMRGGNIVYRGWIRVLRGAGQGSTTNTWTKDYADATRSPFHVSRWSFAANRKNGTDDGHGGESSPSGSAYGNGNGGAQPGDFIAGDSFEVHYAWSNASSYSDHAA